MVHAFDFSIPTGTEEMKNSSALHDPHGSDDASSNPSNEINNECSDASQELNNEVLADRTVCSKSQSEERLSDSISDKCVSPSSTNHGEPEMENKIVMASPAKDKLHPSPKCQLISQNDTSVTSPPLDAMDCQEIPALAQETACSDPDSIENLVKSVSDRKCHSFTDMNCDSSELDVNRVLDSQVVDNALSSKEVDMNDACDEVLEADPSVNLSEEKITKVNNENIDVSYSAFNHAGESFLRVRSDLNGEIAYEGEKNLHLDKEAASKEIHSDETGLNASGDSSETDPV